MVVRILLALLLGSTSCRADDGQGLLEAEAVGDVILGDVPRGKFASRLEGACGEARETPIGEPRLDREPYLQNVTDRSAVLLWTADEPAAVVIRQPGGEPETETAVDVGSSSRGLRRYETHLDGLEPATIYCYDVIGQDGIWLSSAGFRTAPHPVDSRFEVEAVIPWFAQVRFVAFGDVGRADPDQFAVLEQLQSVEFDLALLAGDLAYDDGTLAEYDAHFFDVYEDVMRHVPFFPAPGNHDTRGDDGANYRDVFALPESGGSAAREMWYSFRWGPIHVAVIDTDRELAPQVAWLDRDLAASDAPYRIVVTHRPPYSAGLKGSDLAVRAALEPVLVAHRVDLVLSGHDHNYERTVPIDGVTYMVSGGGGAGARPVGRSSVTAFSSQVEHFVYGRADPDALTLWAVDATGQLFDSVRLPRKTPPVRPKSASENRYR